MIRLKQNTENIVSTVLSSGGNYEYYLIIKLPNEDKLLHIQDYSDYPKRYNRFNVTLGDTDDLLNAVVSLKVGNYIYEVHPIVDTTDETTLITKGVLVVGEEIDQEETIKIKNNYIESIYG